MKVPGKPVSDSSVQRMAYSVLLVALGTGCASLTPRGKLVRVLESPPVGCKERGRAEITEDCDPAANQLKRVDRATCRHWAEIRLRNEAAEKRANTLVINDRLVESELRGNARFYDCHDAVARDLSDLRPGASIRVRAPGTGKKPLEGTVIRVEHQSLRIARSGVTASERELSIPLDSIHELETRVMRPASSTWPMVLGGIGGLLVGSLIGSGRCMATGDDYEGPGGDERLVACATDGVSMVLGLGGTLIGAFVGWSLAPKGKTPSWETVHLPAAMSDKVSSVPAASADAGPKLGVAVSPIAPREASELGVDGGLRVTEVEPRSIAERAGVMVNDVILSIRGTVTWAPTSAQHLKSAVADARKTGTASMRVLRGQEQLEIEVSFVPGAEPHREEQAPRVPADAEPGVSSVAGIERSSPAYRRSPDPARSAQRSKPLRVDPDGKLVKSEIQSEAVTTFIRNTYDCFGRAFVEALQGHEIVGGQVFVKVFVDSDGNLSGPMMYASQRTDRAMAAARTALAKCSPVEPPPAELLDILEGGLELLLPPRAVSGERKAVRPEPAAPASEADAEGQGEGQGNTEEGGEE